jgi:hypothetical protein
MTVPTAINRADILPSNLERSLQEVRRALEQMRYGHIAVTVHDGKVVQLDITEKKRFS